MGTNYYLRTAPIIPLGHLAEEVHLGKSSYGWTFALHVLPECGIHDLSDMTTWLDKKLENKRSVIVNEYGERLTLLQFLEVVAKRSNPARIKDGWDYDWWSLPESLRMHSYDSEEHFHRANNSERGPSGLLRRQIGEFCIGHGSGTWDLCVGYFS